MNIVITGASKGIGRAIAERFAARGYSLFICARNEGPLKLLAEELEAAHPGIRVHYRSCDVSEPQQVSDFADWVLELAPAVDVLVNNAGAFIRGQVHDEPAGVLEELMRTNLYSAYHLTRALLPGMIERRSGHIFNVCSIASLKAYPFGGSYSITKYALAGFSTNLRDELKGFDVKVTAVFPGAAFTGSWEESGIARERFMEAADIAEMVFTAAHLSPRACVEEILIRPQGGDI